MRFAGLQLLIACFALFVSVSNAQTLRVEAETALLSGPNIRVMPVPQTLSPKNVDGDHTAPNDFSGRGYLTGFVDPNDQASLRFRVPKSGIYRLLVAYRCKGHKGYEIEINGLHITGIFPDSNDLTFNTHDAGKIELSAGENQITINRGWGFFDIDYLEVTLLERPASPIFATAPPSDPAATPAARSLLVNVEQAFGKSTMLGVYSDDDADYVQKTTGLLPTIMGGDLIDYSPQRAMHLDQPSAEVERVIADWKRGYIVTLCWHWASPSGQMNTESEPWWKSFYTEATTFDLARVLDDPTGKDYALLLSDIDAIAVQLRRLQDAGVPILWRPLHEAAGGWFWWGARGPQPYVQLWRLLFDRLTKVDGIHNLIWVYTGDDNPLWYPGDRYVDVIGIDQYPRDLLNPESDLWEALRHQHPSSKPLAISEFGGVPDIPRMQRLGEFWSYAVSWSGGEGPRKNTSEDLKRIYTSPNVTTRAVSPASATSPAGVDR